MRLRARNITFERYARSVHLAQTMLTSLGVAVMCGGLFAAILFTVRPGMSTIKLSLIFLLPYLGWQLMVLLWLDHTVFADRYYLCDMPYRCWQTKLMLVPLLLPFGVIALAVSAINRDIYGGFKEAPPDDYDGPRAQADRLLAQNPETRDLAEAALEVLRADELVEDDLLELTIEFGTRPVEPERIVPLPEPQHVVTPEDTSAAPVAPVAAVLPDEPLYYSSPNAARLRYVELRTEAFEGVRQRQSRDAEQAVAEQTDLVARLAALRKQEAARARGLANRAGEQQARSEVTTLTADLRAAQQRLNDLTVQRDTLLASQPQSVSRQIANEEFDELLQLPNVVAVEVINQDVAIIVAPRMEYRGDTYDLGDWRLRFGPDTGLELSAYCVRDSLRKSWCERGVVHPAYRYRRDTSRFCFSNREDEINRLFRNGQFFEAVAVAIESLHYINPEDRNRIPDAYKKVKS